MSIWGFYNNFEKWHKLARLQNQLIHWTWKIIKNKKYTTQVFFSTMWPTFTKSGNYFLDNRNYGDYFLNSSSIVCTWNVLKCNQNSSSWLFDGVCVFLQVSILSKLQLPHYLRKYFQMFNLLQRRVNPFSPPPPPVGFLTHIYFCWYCQVV